MPILSSRLKKRASRTPRGRGCGSGSTGSAVHQRDRRGTREDSCRPLCGIMPSAVRQGSLAVTLSLSYHCGVRSAYSSIQFRADDRSLIRLSSSPRPLRLHRRGCPVSELRDKLRRVGLRPTRQRVSLGWLLFGKGDRHITAEMLFDEATRARVPGLAGDRLQHPAPVHGSGPPAPARGGRGQGLFRHQPDRASPLLPRGRG